MQGQKTTGGPGPHFIPTDAAESIIYYTHFTYPIALLVLFITSLAVDGIVSSSTDTTTSSSGTSTPAVTGPGGKPLPKNNRVNRAGKNRTGFSHTKKLLFCYLSVGLVASFICNAVNIIVHALADREKGWWCGESTAVYVVASTFLYILFLISLIDTKLAPTVAYQVTWSVALIGEILLLVVSTGLYISPHRELNSLRERHGKIRKSPSEWEIIELVIDAIRVLLLVFVVGFYAIFTLHSILQNRKSLKVSETTASETTPLLNGHAAAENGNGSVAPPSTDGNGQANGASTAPAPSTEERAAFYRPVTAPSKTWWEYLKGYTLFFPYLWPSKSRRLQIVVIICFFLVILQRVINMAVPYQVGVVTNRLSGEGGHAPEMPWLQISLLIAFKLLQGSSGLLGALRSVLWIPISQFSYQALSTASFEHVHGLSLDFHLGKRTGEVLSALSKGSAINTFLEQVTFQVLPMIFDLGLAIMYFLLKFDAYYGLVVFIVAFWYMYLTIRMAQWRAEQRRQMVNADREEDAVKNDSIQSYETVKYFNAEAYEFNRYRKAVQVFQRAEYKVLWSLNVMNITQNMVFMTGLLVTAFIAAYQVTLGQRTVGDFVALITYMQQLQAPLNFFGTFYRSIQSAMISGERLLELFKEQPTVVDEPQAAPMPACEGQISFQDVLFSYDTRKAALQNLSFTCLPGTTTALVGESGGGKSTIFRLLFRFYNTQKGSIQLDGNDVRDVTIDSLRSHIGVVPQDTVLFNETLMYNLRYANQNATDEQIYDACRAASIHDKILAFPDGYQTKVGERGLRLSGGEKQRVAIARTILKNPRIIMLDEATAALDSETEQHIQEALKTLSEGRTMLVIAHRLSTITNADQILVLHSGAVVESGTHQELLEKKGRYASMWKKQIRAEKAAEEARVLSDRAAALRKEALARPSSQAGEGSEEASESETEHATPAAQQGAPNLAGRALGRAAEGLRDAAYLLRGPSEDGGKPAGHP